MSMNKKQWVIIGLVSVAVIGTIGYLIYRKNKNKSTDNPPLQKSAKVDSSSQAVKVTESRYAKLKEMLDNYEYKNNALYDKKTGGKIGEEASWSVWGLLHRNYISLMNGVNNDKSINADTKEYALKVMEQFKNELEKVFPPSVFSDKSKLYSKHKLDTIKVGDIYNEKV